MDNCGCGNIKGPLLTEGKSKSLLTEGFKYHMEKNVPLFESIYRIGSKQHLSLIKEARKMYSRNVIDLCEDDEALIKTHLGEFALYEGESVPLDLPMLNEANKISDDKLMRLISKMPKGYVGKNTGIGKYTISTPDGEDIVLTQSKDKKNWSYEPSNVALKILNESYEQEETDNQNYLRMLDMYKRASREEKKNLKRKVEKAAKQVGIKLQLDENKVIDYIKNQGKEVIDNLKAKFNKVITTAKEEGGETLQMFKLLAKQKSGTKLTPQESKLVSDQGKDLLKMFFTGAGVAGGFTAVVSVLPVAATVASLISLINFLDLDDELLKYTDSSKDSARGLTSVEKDKSNFKDIGGVKYIKYNVVEPYLDQADAVAESLQETIKKVLDEKKAKKKKKKDPPIGKPKRGGSKAYYVYVRDPKTKKVKKVSFGSGGLRAKIKNKKARNAFAARHNCKNKKDRTKAGYWSCNLPRYASMLGLGANMNTFW